MDYDNTIPAVCLFKVRENNKTKMAIIFLKHLSKASLSLLQTMLLEKLRVTKRPATESTFNVFYYMMAGADGNLR